MSNEHTPMLRIYTGDRVRQTAEFASAHPDSVYPNNLEHGIGRVVQIDFQVRWTSVYAEREARFARDVIGFKPGVYPWCVVTVRRDGVICDDDRHGPLIEILATNVEQCRRDWSGS